MHHDTHTHMPMHKLGQSTAGKAWTVMPAVDCPSLSNSQLVLISHHHQSSALCSLRSLRMPGALDMHMHPRLIAPCTPTFPIMCLQRKIRAKFKVHAWVMSDCQLPAPLDQTLLTQKSHEAPVHLLAPCQLQPSARVSRCGPIPSPQHGQWGGISVGSAEAPPLLAGHVERKRMHQSLRLVRCRTHHRSSEAQLQRPSRLVCWCAAHARPHEQQCG